MALLAWIPNEKKFLKIQEGTGDNLSNEDIANGYCDYVLWNIFNPGELDADEEWLPEHLDGGMLLLKDERAPIETLKDAYEVAFDDVWAEGKVIILQNI